MGSLFWYGDEVLEYKLTETDSKGYISDGDKEGTLDNKTVEVTCENNIDKPTPVTLTLKKLIKDGVPPGEKFTFLVKTEGAIDNFGNTTEMEYVPIVLDAGQEATFKFTPESKTTPVKYWVYEYISEDSKTKPNRFIVSKNGEITDDSKIKEINKYLGFSDSVYTKMIRTRALDGMQTDSIDGIKVTWTYHPDHGLEVIYELIK